MLDFMLPLLSSDAWSQVLKTPSFASMLCLSFQFIVFVDFVLGKGDIDENTTNHISMGWQIWRNAHGELYHKKIPTR